jgi:hypothetical protein
LIVPGLTVGKDVGYLSNPLNPGKLIFGGIIEPFIACPEVTGKVYP